MKKTVDNWQDKLSGLAEHLVNKKLADGVMKGLLRGIAALPDDDYTKFLELLEKTREELAKEAERRKRQSEALAEYHKKKKEGKTRTNN